MSAKPVEIDPEGGLIGYDSRARQRARCATGSAHDVHALLADADRLVSHGYMRGRQPWRESGE